MRKISWVCIAALIMSIVASCGRMGKMPEGLIKKDTADMSDEVEIQSKSENMDSSLMKEDTEDIEADSNTVMQQNASLYFLDKENNKLVCETQAIMASDISLFANETVLALIRGPQSGNLQPVIPKVTKIIGIEQTDNIVTVNLSEEFLEAEDLLTARTALVNTLTEREEIKYVKININGQELTNDGTQNGEPLGVLSRTTSNIDELVAAQNRIVSEDSIKEINRELFFRDFRGRYLLSEVRPIKVKNGGIARAIIEELIKGPVEASSGAYPVIPQGTQLLDINLLDGDKEDSKIVALYFSKELKSPFTAQGTSRGDKKEDPKEVQDKADQVKNKENIILSSIVYSLSGLPNIESVKIFYQDKYGNYIDTPLHGIDLKKPLKTTDFPDKLGRKVKVYFANTGATHLVPDYRAMSRENVQIANTIVDELILGPRENTDQTRVIPTEVARGDIKIWMDPSNTMVMVDLPSSKLDGNKIGSTGALMALYAIVNSLTDPMNTPNIKQVQFLVDGNIVKTFGNLEFSEPFIRNPAIIQE